MPVPVELDFGRGKKEEVIVLVDEVSETFVLPVDSKPKRVTLNPNHAVLARVEKLRGR